LSVPHVDGRPLQPRTHVIRSQTGSGHAFGSGSRFICRVPQQQMRQSRGRTQAAAVGAHAICVLTCLGRELETRRGDRRRRRETGDGKQETMNQKPPVHAARTAKAKAKIVKPKTRPKVKPPPNRPRAGQWAPGPKLGSPTDSQRQRRRRLARREAQDKGSRKKEDLQCSAAQRSAAQ
jgi:hypothetical protein